MKEKRRPHSSAAKFCRLLSQALELYARSSGHVPPPSQLGHVKRENCVCVCVCDPHVTSVFPRICVHAHARTPVRPG